VRITDQTQLGNIFPVKYRTPIVDGRYLPGTFQPTFLYEFIWDLATFGLLLLIERRVRLRRGYLFAAYVSLYTFGRFFVEYIRIDPAHRYLGLRLNDWTSVAVFLAATALLFWKGPPRTAPAEFHGVGPDLLSGPSPTNLDVAPRARRAALELVGDPLPARVLEAERQREAARRPVPPSQERDDAATTEAPAGPQPGSGSPAASSQATSKVRSS
jgi:hypothetical protein